MGFIVKAIGSGVGLVAELSNSNKKSPSNTDLKHHQQRFEDEHDQASSKAVQKVSSRKRYDIGGQVTVDLLVELVMNITSPPPYQIPSNNRPVILPQRRPGTRSRGFVRAYAPVLTDYGIEQDAFLSFIKNLDVAVQASPMLNVVFVSAGIVGMVPHGWAMIASTVTQVVVGAAMEYQQRSRGNSYMDKINDQLFRPRGLYAVVMSYVPNAQRPIETAPTDINALMPGQAAQSPSLLGPKLQKGSSYGELELPESAPLIYCQAKRKDESAVKEKARWMGDYMDRREQARYMKQNPDSRLNPPEEQQPTFISGLADPNHPAFSGSWVTLFSGGKIAPKKQCKEARMARQAGFSSVEEATQNGVEVRSAKTLRQNQKKAAKSKILYLMLVPIPSDAELFEARQQLGMIE